MEGTAQYLSPVLAQFSVAASNGPDLPALELDWRTGLYHRVGITTPFVEELLSAATSGNLQLGETLLTEAKDNPDPDLLRCDQGTFQHIAITSITRAETDPADPDLIRLEHMREVFTDALVTAITKNDADPVDPDLIRGHQRIRDCLC